MFSLTTNTTLDTGLGPNTRNLVVCIDGTANQFSEKNTNVVELYSRIRKNKNQITYYNSGIGTYARPSWWSFAYLKQQAMSYIDLAIAWNFDQVVIAAYRWLSEHYQPGDRVFLFGFSRGAYQVRTLAGMIEKVGLIHRGNQEQIPFAWEVYSNNVDPEPANFKKTFSRDKVDIHFVGVWDTVASVGLFSRKTFPLADECSHIKHFRHALALDELRVKFLPENVVNKGTSKISESFEEVWFVGTHSDIGGGNKRNITLDGGEEPLKWMMDEAYAHGLSFKHHDVKLALPRAEVTDSMRGLIYPLLEMAPFLRWKTYLPDGTLSFSWMPHFMRPREVLVPAHLIHWTVVASLRDSGQNTSYTPQATIIGSTELAKHTSDTSKGHQSPISWNEMSTAAGSKDIVEPWSNRPSCVDNRQYMRLVEILQARNASGTQKDEWLVSLHEYACEGALGNADAIWTYGGPQFLQSLFKEYPNSNDAEHIVRAAVGYDKRFNWIEAPFGPTQETRIESFLPEEQKSRFDLLMRLRDIVAPRVGLLLEQWTTKCPETENPKFGSGISRLCKSLQLRLRPENNKRHVHWNWDQLPKGERSMAMAHVVTMIIVQVAETSYREALQESSESIARSLSAALLELTQRATNPIESPVNGENDKARLTEGILNAIKALCSFSAPIQVFSSESIATSLVSLIEAGDRHPDLAVQAMYTAARLAFDESCSMTIAKSGIIPSLIAVMRQNQAGDEFICEELARSASSAMHDISKSIVCSDVLAKEPIIDDLFELMRREKYTTRVLRVLRNVSAYRANQFNSTHVLDLVHQMARVGGIHAVIALDNVVLQDSKGHHLRVIYQADIANNLLTLLGQERDDLIEATASLLEHLIGQKNKASELLVDAPVGRILSPEVSQALAVSLGATCRSQVSIEQLLKAILRFALEAPLSSDLFETLAPLARIGNVLAILAASASAAHDEYQRGSVAEHIPNIIKLVTRYNKDTSLQYSMEVLIVLINNGYTLEERLLQSIVSGVDEIVWSAVWGDFFSKDVTYSRREEALITTFGLIEAFCNNAATESLVYNSRILKVVEQGSGGQWVLAPFRNHAQDMLRRVSKQGLAMCPEGVSNPQQPRQGHRSDAENEVQNEGADSKGDDQQECEGSEGNYHEETGLLISGC